MKSSKNKKEKSFDFEMKHLKEHLNTSLDFNNITVSEELLEKTLNAINTGTAPKVTPSDANDYVAAPKVIPSDVNDNVTAPKLTPSDVNDNVTAPKLTPSDVNDYDKEKNDSTDDRKKKSKFPIFKFAGAAAAVVILVIGINKIQDNLFMGKKDTSASNSTMDLATEKSIEEKADVVNNDAASITETESSTAKQSSEDTKNKESSIEISQNKNNMENRVTSDASKDTAAESKEENDAVKEETEIVDTFDATSESVVTTDTASDNELLDIPIKYSLNSITQKASDNKSFSKQDNLNYPIKVTDYIILEDIYQISFYDQHSKENIDGTNENRYTKNPDVIKEFYQLLNECTFTQSDDVSGDLSYEIVILSKNKEQSYTINIKDGIQLQYQDKLHPEYDYQVNMQGSTEKLKNWIVKYMQ